jgi:hypothetical protein
VLLPELSPFGPRLLEKEWPFLCACASPVANLESLRQFLQADMNWEVLLDLAEEHCVQGLLAKWLALIDFAGVPLGARQRLQAMMRAQSVFTLSMTAELFRVLEEVSRARVDTILIKGPVTSLLAYDDPGVRNYVDLDLLVRQQDIQLATQRLLAIGFEADTSETLIQAGKIPGEYLFNRPGAKHVIELHTDRTFRYYPRRMPIEQLFTRKRHMAIDGKEVPALSLEDEFVLDCVHGAKHFWERLMWVADIAAIVQKHPEINWDKVHRFAEDVGALRMIRVGVHLGELVFGATAPSAIADEIKNDEVCQQLSRRITTWLPYAGYEPPPLFQRAMFRLQIGGGGFQGMSYLLRLSLSPTEEDWKEGEEERRSWVWDALWRPLRLIRKYGQHR